MERKVSITLAILLILINLYLAGLYQGYLLGMEAYSHFKLSHNGIQTDAVAHFGLLIWLSIFTVLRFLNKNNDLTILIIGVISLLVPVAIYKSLTDKIIFVLSQSAPASDELFRYSVLDLLGLFLFAALFILQIVIMIQRIFEKVNGRKK